MKKIIQISFAGIFEPDLVQYLPKFSTAKRVAKLKHFILYKAITKKEINYGLFVGKTLVGVLLLSKYDKEKYQIQTQKISQMQRGQGLVGFMLDYAVMNDKLLVLSEKITYPFIKSLWNGLRHRDHGKICYYDLITNTVVNITDECFYKDPNRYVWIVFPTERTINETLEQINAKYKGLRQIRWYDPGDETFFNW